MLHKPQNQASNTLTYLLNSSLEYCWLAVILLIPLSFTTILDHPLALPLSIEFPKIIIFRLIVFLMGSLWLISQLFRLNSLSCCRWLIDLRTLRSLKVRMVIICRWFFNNPFRVVSVFSAVYFLSVALSTMLSSSLKVSVWGYIPSSDDSSAYNLLCYGIFYMVLASNLNNRAQLWRLFAAILLAGILVSTYGVLQYFNLGFLGIGEESVRVTSTLGNPIFLSSFLVFTIGISLIIGTVQTSLRNSSKYIWALRLLWVFILAIQIAALVCTSSRGPTIAIVISSSVFIGLLTLICGFRIALRSSIILTASVLVAMALVLAPSQLPIITADSSDINRDTGISLIDRTYSDFTVTEVSASSLLQRINIAKVSLDIVFDRPKLTPDSNTRDWKSYLFGYGPELFRTAFMMQSYSLTEDKLPISTNHPHNFMIHAWIELGILGFISIFGIVTSIVLVGVFRLFYERHLLNFVESILLIGIVALIIGRSAEQMLGVPRVTDLILFWAIVAVVGKFRAITSSETHKQEVASLSAYPSTFNFLTLNNAGRLCLISLLISGFGVLTWHNAVVPSLALAKSSYVNDDFNRGDLVASLNALNESIKLDPDQFMYYSNLAHIYQTDLDHGNGKVCPGLEVGDETKKCLMDGIYNSYMSAINAGDTRWQTRYEAAQSAVHLADLLESELVAMEAIRLYEESIDMVPHSYVIKNSFASALLKFGNPKAAREVLLTSLDITGMSPASVEARFLQGLSYADEGDIATAVDTWNAVLQLDSSYAPVYHNFGLISEDNGESKLAIDYYSTAIMLAPTETDSYIRRAAVYLAAGMNKLSEADTATALELGADRRDLYPVAK